jgi:hypothetical protein
VDADMQNFTPLETGLVVDQGVVVAGFSKSFTGTAWTAGVNAIEDTGSTLSSDDIVRDDTVEIMYPNPANDILNISFKNSLDFRNSSIEIYSMLGNKVGSFDIEKEVVDGKVILPISSLATGNYMVKIIVSNSVSNEILIKK